VIKFEKSQYTVNEPIIPGDVNVLRVPVIRLGDTSGTSEVRVSTKSGSASAGRDFNGHSICMLTFYNYTEFSFRKYMYFV
jgi:hypothetical protein